MILDRFLKYVSFDTKSNPNSKIFPSNKNELIFGEYLKNELLDLGLEDVHMSEYGYVYGMIKGNNSKDKIGFISHLDTSYEVSGKDIKPLVIRNYDGLDIKYNNMKVSDFPILKEYIGKDIIVTNGKTLLGADDKAGISIIMSFLEKVINSKDNLNYGDIYVCFTPDEEIGEGTKYFDTDWFKVDYAYTIDGEKLGELNYENFNAASAKISIKGSNIHPGSGKDKLINASLIANEFISLLPSKEIPYYTSGYEGFNHLINIKGDCEKCNFEYIIRNHDRALFEKQKNLFIDICKKINNKYKKEICKCNIKDSYYNMKDIIGDNHESVKRAIKAFNELNIKLDIIPIRGGTDGALLTYKGISTPNLSTGGINFHSKYELACLDEMKQMVDVLIKIVENN